MQESVLVIGGTGMLGLPVAEKLRTSGFRVTIMTTRPQLVSRELGDRFSVVAGDVTDRASLARAMDGQDFVYLNLNAKRDPALYERIEIRGSALAATVARDSGVKRLITITGASSKGREEGPIYLRAKVQAERAIMESGIPYTIMRASWFFESLPHFVRDGGLAYIGRQPIPRRWLAASDYAAQVVNAYRTQEAENKCFYNLGPEALTIGEAVRRFGRVCHPDMRVRMMPVWMVRLAGLLTGRTEYKSGAAFFAYFNRIDEDVDGAEADRLLGPNRTTLDDWLRHYCTKRSA